MKKFLKGIMGLASIAAVAGGAYYLTKKWLEDKDEEFDEDFDDLDFDDEDDDSREYVTLDLDEDGDEEEDGEETEDTEDTEGEE